MRKVREIIDSKRFIVFSRVVRYSRKRRRKFKPDRILAIIGIGNI